MSAAEIGEGMTITSYRDLDVYRRSMQALVTVHKLALAFPDFERYVLADQLRRASKSIPANIAEGYGRRRSAKEFKRFLAMALGSTNEVIVHLEIGRELGYSVHAVLSALSEEYTVIGKMLYRLIDNWRTWPAPRTKPTTPNIK